MNKTISIGRIYAAFERQAGGSPLIDRATTVERTGERRIGDGYLIRLPFTGGRPTVGLVLGVWRRYCV